METIEMSENGTATPKDVVDVGISIYLEFAVPEVVEQTLKETGAKDTVVNVVTSAVSTAAGQIWDWFMEEPAP